MKNYVRQHIKGIGYLASLTILGVFAFAAVANSDTICPPPPPPPPPPPVAMNRVSLTCASAGYDVANFRKQADPFKSFGVSPSAHPHDSMGYIGFSSTGITAAAEKAASDAAGHTIEPGYHPLFSNCPFYGNWPLWLQPTAILNGQTLTPTTMTVTMQAPVGVQLAGTPFGWTFIAGNSSAINTTQMGEHVYFNCGGIDDLTKTPRDCTGIPGGVVTAEIIWPDCWDKQGNINETPMGISPVHFYYDTNGACPAGGTGPSQTAPGQLMAQDITRSTWLAPGTNTPLQNPLDAQGNVALTFSSGPYWTFHMDYQDLWNGGENTIITVCLNQAKPCPPGTIVGSPGHAIQ